jgi:hypothetical protein
VELTVRAIEPDSRRMSPRLLDSIGAAPPQYLAVAPAIR